MRAELIYVEIKTPTKTQSGTVEGSSFLDVTSDEDFEEWFNRQDVGDGFTQATEKVGYIDELQRRVTEAIDNDDPNMFRCAAQAGIEMNGELGEVFKVTYEISDGGNRRASHLFQKILRLIDDLRRPILARA